MTEQLEFSTPSKPVTDHDVAWLLGRLHGRGWLTAAEIMGGTATENEKRRIRAIVAEANGKVLSGPGAHGYIITTEATLEEIDHVVAQRRSQEMKMEDGTRAILRVLLDRRFADASPPPTPL